MRNAAYELRRMFDGNQAIGCAVTSPRQTTFFASIAYLVHLVKVSPHFNSKTGISTIGCADDVFHEVDTWSSPEKVLRNGVFGEKNFTMISRGTWLKPRGSWLIVDNNVYLYPAREMFTNILRLALDQPQPRSLGPHDRPADNYRTQVLYALENGLTVLANIGRRESPKHQAA